MRRFSLSSMRDFGVGKKSLEGRVQDVMDEMEHQTGPFFPKRIYLNAISNIICGIVFGNRYICKDIGGKGTPRLTISENIYAKHNNQNEPTHPYFLLYGLRDRKEQVGFSLHLKSRMAIYFPDLKLVWLWHWTSSARFEYSDPDFQTLLDCLEYLGQNAGIQMPENILPIIAYIPGLSKVSFVVVVVGGVGVVVVVQTCVVQQSQRSGLGWLSAYGKSIINGHRFEKCRILDRKVSCLGPKSVVCWTEKCRILAKSVVSWTEKCRRRFHVMTSSWLHFTPRSAWSWPMTGWCAGISEVVSRSIVRPTTRKTSGTFWTSTCARQIKGRTRTFTQVKNVLYSDVIMGEIASKITSLSIVCSPVCSDSDQRKHQSSASLAFVGGIYRWPVNSPHKGPVTRKIFTFDDVIMYNPHTLIPGVKRTQELTSSLTLYVLNE